MEIRTQLDKELISSYLDYAMSVIIGRAIPDVRDGLKPVQRRILWTMWEEGARSSTPFRKSARIVGSTIGKYHPHGDAPVYEALVRMAQDFNMRYPLVEGQGNFGSIDGDEPAAMRYSEARMSKLAEEMMIDIEENTVDFRPNYDESLQEPEVLPARFPNIIINGTTGIAVGMSTSIPPHNIKEIITAIINIIEKKENPLSAVKGPDLPTGGLVIFPREIYEEGRGQFSIYSRYKVEKGERTKKIVFFEVPYQQEKSKIVEKIAKIIQERAIDGVLRVKDESDRRGIRIVVEVRKDVEIKNVVARLYELTPLKVNFVVNMLVIDNMEPKHMNLRKILERFIEFRKEVVLRRTKFRLDKAEKRMHILEGFLKALDKIDEIIDLIKKSENPSDAREKLKKVFGFSEEQANAILEIKLAKLSKLEREEVILEYEKLKNEVEKMRKIMKDEKELMGVIKSELEEIMQKYGDERRSEIAEKPPIEEEIKEQEIKFSITPDFYISTFSKAEKIRKIPVLRSFIHAGDIVAVSSAGKVFRIKQDKIKSWVEKGIPIQSLIRLSKDEKVVAVCPANEDENLIMITKKGLAKKFRLSEIENITARGEIAFEVEAGDEVVSAIEVGEKENIYIITKGCFILGVSEEEITPRVSRAIELMKANGMEEDEVVLIVKEEGNYLLVASEKHIKMVEKDELKIQKKGGTGIIIFPRDKGKIVSATFVNEDDTISITYEKDKKIGVKYLDAKKIPVLGRQAMGKEFEDGRIISVGKVI